jgi:NADH-quinone oxidoreductase subunit J
VIVLNTILFYFLSALAVGSAVMMVTRRNIVHGAIFLMTALLATAGIFLLLQAELLFIVQIVLCAGGTMVLFVLVIMLVNPNITTELVKFSRQRFIATALTVVLAAQVLFAIFVGRTSLRLPAMQLSISPKNAEAVGDALFHQFIVPFEIVSVLLLVAMIGAGVMAKRRGDAIR